MASTKTTPDSLATIRERMRRAAKESEMTLEEIGLRMGFSKDGARQAVSRLLNPNAEYDPRLSTVLSFASAIGRSIKEII
jgi:transcriptional regulator with XRE-family HTH domain